MSLSALLVAVAMLTGLPMVGAGAYCIYVGRAIRQREMASIPTFLRFRLPKHSANTIANILVVLGLCMLFLGLAMPTWIWWKMAGIQADSP